MICLELEVGGAIDISGCSLLGVSKQLKPESYHPGHSLILAPLEQSWVRQVDCNTEEGHNMKVVSLCIRKLRLPYRHRIPNFARGIYVEHF